MDIKKLSSLEPTQIPSQKAKVGGITQGPSFEELLKNNTNLRPDKMNPDLSESVRFSNHAVERMMSRGIKFAPEDMNKLEEAIGRAASKGSKNSLILMNDAALIVSVKNKTVVTVMDKMALKENVFTNIDSTIVM